MNNSSKVTLKNVEEFEKEKEKGWKVKRRWKSKAHGHLLINGLFSNRL